MFVCAKDLIRAYVIDHMCDMKTGMRANQGLYISIVFLI